ncbi:MAG: secretion protein [Myxococcales bacterium]|nr:secretion protein [Myxococcales bacterium]
MALTRDRRRPRPRRGPSGVLRALVLVAAGAGLLVGCRSTVRGGLAERSANDLVLALHARGIDATKVGGGGAGDARFDVRVPASELGRALEVLHDANLPREPSPGLADVFAKGSLVPTATEERARYVSGLDGELERTLERIDGVLGARVHVALPDQEASLRLDTPPPRARASVLIEYRAGHEPPDVAPVRALIAGAVQNLSPGDVAVVSLPSEPRAPATPSWVQVGPITVTEGSAETLRVVLVGAFGLNIALAAALIATLWSRRRTRRAHAPASDQAA